MMLAQSLKELEADGLVKRTQYNEVPPRVEYSLTMKGVRALPMLTAAAEWAVKELGFEDFMNKAPYRITGGQSFYYFQNSALSTPLAFALYRGFLLALFCVS